METLNNYMIMPRHEHGMTDEEIAEYYKRLAEKEDMMWEERVLDE